MKRSILTWAILALVMLIPAVSNGQVGMQEINRITYDILLQEYRQMPVTVGLDYPWASYGVYDEFLSKNNIASIDTVGAAAPTRVLNTEFGWTITTTNTTVSTPDSLGGILKFTPTAAALNGFMMQWNREAFLTSAKSYWNEWKVASSDFDATDMVIGMTVTKGTIATLLDSVNAAVDGEYFFRDSLNVLRAVSVKNEASTFDATIISATDFAGTANTYYKFSIWFDGNSTVRFYIDDKLVATHNTAANHPSDELLTPTVAYRRLRATAGNFWVDYTFTKQLK